MVHLNVASRIVFGLTLLSLVACSHSVQPTDDAAAPDGSIVFVPVGAQTVASEKVAAGDQVLVHCLLLDALGESNVPTPEQTYFVRVDPESSVTFADDGTLVALVAGEIAVTCVFPDLGLSDPSPAIVEVTPGVPAFVEAH